MATKSIRLSDGTDTLLPKSAVSDFNYCKMADGTLLQWGYEASKASGAEISFPIPFVTNTPEVMISGYYNAASTIRCIFSNIPALNKFTVYAYDVSTGAISTATNLQFRWLAIGRWK